jgi:uncharacterized protein (TIGR02996 family)
MNEEDPFLDALQSNPQDVAARLVYADWLEERGDARGEYLRLEEELERIQARLREARQQLDPGWLKVVSPSYLRYDLAYHLHCELPLRSGRTITLEALDQVMTYAGLLEGTPDRESNDREIEFALREAYRHCVDGVRPHLIPPPRRDHLREPGDMQRVIAHSPHRVPEWLPLVRCIGSFKDVVKVRHPDKALSVLTVVWFQDEYALPIREPALSQLRELDWESLAVDVDF